MSEINKYIVLTVALIVLQNIYLFFAKKYKIVDVPNYRSSHTLTIIRGGGIVFPLSTICYFIFFKWSVFLFIGMLLISSISILDDIKNLSVKIRLAGHLISICCILIFSGIFHFPIYILLGAFIIILGIINAYNFMDGINGITGLYTLVVLLTLYFLNYISKFIDSSAIILPIISTIIFLYFNFRRKAKCFAGDVGSVSIGLWVSMLILLVIIKFQNITFILFLSVYGIDTVLTILQRLYLKQNIFKAHRLHFFQYLVNERKFSHLNVTLLYSTIQVLVNIFVINSPYSTLTTFIVTLLPLTTLYILFKFYLGKYSS